MKTLALLLILIALAACTSIKKKTDHMHAGTPKSDFLRVLGEPIKTSNANGAEILSYHDRNWNCDFEFADDVFVSRTCTVDTGPVLTPEERAARSARYNRMIEALGNSKSDTKSYGEYWLQSQPEKTTCRERIEFGKRVYDCEKSR